MTQQVDPDTGEIFESHKVTWFPDEWLQYSDEAAIHAYSFELEQMKIRQAKVGRWEQELMRRVAESGATVIRGNDMNFVITTKNECDRSKLPPVLELFDPEGKAKSFTAAHMEEVLIPDKWDMQQVNKYAKQAADLQHPPQQPSRSPHQVSEWSAINFSSPAISTGDGGWVLSMKSLTVIFSSTSVGIPTQAFTQATIRRALASTGMSSTTAVTIPFVVGSHRMLATGQMVAMRSPSIGPMDRAVPPCLLGG